MNTWVLPKSLNVCGIDYKIRTDFRAILDILIAFNDPELENHEKPLAMLDILYLDFEILEDANRVYVKAGKKFLPQNEVEEAIKQAIDFIDAGIERDHVPKPRMMDWEQDAPIIFPSINKMFGKDIRLQKYMHWWTFLGFFMEIPEGMFLQIVNIRQKMKSGKKLEKWEEKFYRENKKLCDLQSKYTEEEKKELDALNKLLD